MTEALSLRAPMRVSTFLLVLLLQLHCLQAFTFRWVAVDGRPQTQERCQPPSFTTCNGAGAAQRSVPPGVVLYAKKSDGEKIENTTISSNKNSSTADKTVSHLENDANLSSLTMNNPTWDQNIAALLEYKEIHGTVNLPVHSKKYPNLGLWVFNLGRQIGRLTNEQIQQLNDIGFLWKGASMAKNDKHWHEMFMRLKAYKEEHGDCLVPNKYGLDPKLGRWVMTQRRNYRDEKIKPERKEMLESIGFVWRLVEFSERDRPDLEESWEKRYQELIEFKEEHGHTNVPRDYPPNKELSIWVNTQRQYKKRGMLHKDRILRLDKIGFNWEFEPIWDESWLEQYEELKTYYQELASYNEIMENNPEGSETATRPVQDQALRTWASTQRRLHSKGDLDPQRKEMLDDIGFQWWE